MRRPAIARANFHADKGGGWWFLHSRSRRHFRSVEVSACFICPEGAKFSYWRSEEPSAFHASSPAASSILAGGERQSCQASHLPLLRQDDCRNFAPLERGHLDSGRKAAVLFVFGECKFSMPPEWRGVFPVCPAREAFFPSPAAFLRSCAFRLLPALKSMRRACLLGKNRI